MKRIAFLIIALPILLFAVIFSGPNTAAAQAGGMAPVQDTYSSRNNPGAVLNGNSLLLSYDVFGPFQPSDFSYLKFDLTGQTTTIAYSTLVLTIVDNFGAADDVSVGLYSITDDSWDAATLTHDNAPMPGTLLQTLTINRGFEGIIKFGDGNNIHPVGTFFESERRGDGIASLMMRLDDATNPDFFQGSLIMDDVEGSFDGQNGNEPALMPAESPTAISLSQVSGTAVTPIPSLILIPFLLLGFLTLVVLRRQNLLNI